MSVSVGASDNIACLLACKCVGLVVGGNSAFSESASWTCNRIVVQLFCDTMCVFYGCTATYKMTRHSREHVMLIPTCSPTVSARVTSVACEIGDVEASMFEVPEG